MMSIVYQEKKKKNQKMRAPPFLVLVLALLSLLAVSSVAAQKKPRLDDVLGVKCGPKLTKAEVRKAYQRLVKLHHPDLAPASKKEEAVAMTALLNEAYTVLSGDKMAEYCDRGFINPESTAAEPIVSATTFNLTMATWDNLVRLGRGSTAAAASPRDHPPHLQPRDPASAIWIIQVYQDASSECRGFAPAWDRLPKKYPEIFRFGRINLREQPALTASLLANVTVGRGAKQVLPALYAVHPGPNGAVVLFAGGRATSATAAAFIEEQLPTSLLQQVDTPAQFKAFELANRDFVRAFVFSVFHNPPLAYRAMAFRLRHSVRFAHINDKQAPGRALKDAFKIRRLPGVVVLHEPQVPRMVRSGFRSPQALEKWVADRRNLKLHELTAAPGRLDDLCPQTKAGPKGTRGPNPLLCLVVFADRQDAVAGRSAPRNASLPSFEPGNYTAGARVVRGAIDALRPYAKANRAQGVWVDRSLQHAFAEYFGVTAANASGSVIVLHTATRRFAAVKLQQEAAATNGTAASYRAWLTVALKAAVKGAMPWEEMRRGSIPALVAPTQPFSLFRGSLGTNAYIVILAVIGILLTSLLRSKGHNSSSSSSTGKLKKK
jgi:hypothetical protein